MYDDQTFLTNIYNKQKDLGEKAIAYTKDACSDIQKGMLDIQNLWMEFDLYNVYPWFVAGDLYQEMVLEDIDISPSEINDLVTNPNPSFSSFEEELLLRVAIGEKPISELVSKYFWIPFAYDGPIVNTEESYTKEIAKIKDPESKLAELLKKRKTIVEKNKHLFSKLTDQQKKLVSQIYLLQEMTDYRKEVQYQLHVMFHTLGKKYIEKHELPEDIFYYLFAKEVFSNASVLELYAERKNNYILYAEEENLSYNYDYAQLKKEIFEVSSTANLKGHVASAPEPKLFTGKVKVMAKHTDTFEEGDILVTLMTTPDFVPAMRKAKAIITDEGGITCHAAIVSRELGIPCIIGTKVGTKVLATGDLIEVDANKGIIRKIG